MNELALFAGAGGGILGGKLLGWRTVCAVEIDAYARRVLLARQRDGVLPRFPIWDDVRTFDGCGWRGQIDVVTGGFPCQDISSAGKGAGIEGERSGLWVEMARIIGEVQPSFAFVENSPVLTSRGLGRVLGDLAEMGFDARWGVFGAHHVGAPHERDRIWIAARGRAAMDDTEGFGWGMGLATDIRTIQGAIDTPGHASEDVADPTRLQQGRQEQRTKRQRVRASSESESANPTGDGRQQGNEDVGRRGEGSGKEQGAGSGGCSWWLVEPALGRVAHGVDHRVDRLKAIGNGQVPAVAALAWRTLTERIEYVGER